METVVHEGAYERQSPFWWRFFGIGSSRSGCFLALSILFMPYSGGALPSDDSSPNAISLTCPSANTRIRSDTPGLWADRSELDTGLRSSK